jgi:hypothetical protein
MDPFADDELLVEIQTPDAPRVTSDAYTKGPKGDKGDVADVTGLGLVVKQATAFVARVLAVGAGLTITNADGQADNPTIGLDPTASPTFAGMTLGAGAVGAPAWHLGADTTTGFFRPGANQLGLSVSGVERIRFNDTAGHISVAGTIAARSDAGFAFQTGIGSAVQAVLTSDAANVISIRRSGNAQSLWVYNTYTDASNYERAALAWASNVLQLQTAAGGTGTLRDIALQPSGGNVLVNATTPKSGFGAKFQILGTGSILASGVSSTAGSACYVLDETTNYLTWIKRGSAQAGSLSTLGNGVGEITNFGGDLAIINAGNAAIAFGTNGGSGIVERLRITGSGLLTFGGGTSSSFPALKRQGTTNVLALRVADDSGPADIALGAVRSSSGGLVNFSDNGGGIAAKINYAAFYTGANRGVVQLFATPGGSPSGGAFLWAEAANMLSQANGVNAQVFNVYNTLTDNLNYERAKLAWATNEFVVGTENLGTGAARKLVLAVPSGQGIGIRPNAAATDTWTFNSGGHLVPGSDNAWDIGASANRARHVYLGGNLTVGAGVIKDFGSGQIGIGGAGGQSCYVAASSVQSYGANGFGWGTTFGSPDTFLPRDAAGIIAQRNGASAQAFRIYNTYTDATNYERALLGWTRDGGSFDIVSEHGGTGAARAIRIYTDGAAALGLGVNGGLKWVVESSNGNFIPNSGSSFDLGASATIIRRVYSNDYFMRSGSADPSTTDIPASGFVVWKNTTSGAVKLWANDGGTMKSVALT